jgi:predicted PurR-regulated permease PerM
MLAVAAVIWALYRLERVAFLLILTTFFAYLVAPFVRLAERPMRIAGTERRIPRGLAIGIIYLCILAVVSTGAGILLPRVTQQISDAISQAPAYGASLRAWEQRWAGYYDRSNLPLEVRQGIDRSVVASGKAAIEYSRGSLMALVGALSYVAWLVLIPILAFFLLKDAHQVRRAAIKILPHRFRLRGRRLFDELNTTLATYVRGQLLACVLIGSICGIAFAILGVPYPALLGILAGVLEFIPLVGPFVCAVVATIVAALKRADPGPLGRRVPGESPDCPGLCDLSTSRWPWSQLASVGGRHRCTRRRRVGQCCGHVFGGSSCGDLFRRVPPLAGVAPRRPRW